MSAARPDTWMPLYVGEYLRDTQHLSAERHGVYLLLIMAYWANGRPLTDDDEQLAAIARLSVKEWRRHRSVIGQFFQIGDGVWRHKRVDSELNRAQEIANKRATAGRASAEQRASKRPTHVQHVPQQTGQQTPQQTGRPIQLPKPSETPPDESSDAARAIVGDFFDFRKTFWPDEPSMPAPTLTLETQARSFLEAGAGRRFIVEIFERVMRQKHERGESAPTDLRFCHKTLETELGKLSRASRPVAKPPDKAAESATVTEPWTQRMRGWRKDQFWRDEWGFRPGQRGCRVPDEFLSEEEIAAKHGRAA